MRKLSLVLLLLLAGCSGGANVVQGEGRSIGEIQGEPWDGPLRRIVVAPLLDHTATGEHSAIVEQVGLLTGEDKAESARKLLGGMRDLLTTALFNTGRFILLEREGLDEVMAEQAFGSNAASFNEPMQRQLEGAELLLLGAVTTFDPASSGGLAFPLPVPLNDNGDIGVLDVEMRTAYLAMDMRLIDVASGRVVSSTAVEGRARKFGVAMAGIYSAGGGHIKLPGLLSLYHNTPMEQATLKMVDTAALELVKQTFPEVAEELKRQEEEAMWDQLP